MLDFDRSDLFQNFFFRGHIHSFEKSRPLIHIRDRLGRLDRLSQQHLPEELAACGAGSIGKQ